MRADQESLHHGRGWRALLRGGGPTAEPPRPRWQPPCPALPLPPPPDPHQRSRLEPPCCGARARALLAGCSLGHAEGDPETNVSGFIPCSTLGGGDGRREGALAIAMQPKHSRWPVNFTSSPAHPLSVVFFWRAAVPLGASRGARWWMRRTDARLRVRNCTMPSSGRRPPQTARPPHHLHLRKSCGAAVRGSCISTGVADQPTKQRRDRERRNGKANVPHGEASRCFCGGSLTHGGRTGPGHGHPNAFVCSPVGSDGGPRVCVCVLLGWLQNYFLALCVGFCEHPTTNKHAHFMLRSGDAVDKIRFHGFADLPILCKLVQRHVVSRNGAIGGRTCVWKQAQSRKRACGGRKGLFSDRLGYRIWRRAFVQVQAPAAPSGGAGHANADSKEASDPT